MEIFRERWCSSFHSERRCGFLPYCAWNGTACSLDPELDFLEFTRTTFDADATWNQCGQVGVGQEVNLWAIFGVVVAAIFVVKLLVLFIGPPLYVGVKAWWEEKGTFFRKWRGKCCPCMGESRDPEAIPLIERNQGRPHQGRRHHVAINIV